MALSLRNREVEELARKLSLQTGLNMTETILTALGRFQNELNGEQGKTLEKMRVVVAEFAKLPVLDSRSADEILGYGPDGTFSRDH